MSDNPFTGEEGKGKKKGVGSTLRQPHWLSASEAAAAARAEQGGAKARRTAISPDCAELCNVWREASNRYYGFSVALGPEDTRLMFSHAKLGVSPAEVAQALNLAFWLVDNDEAHSMYRREGGERLLTYREAMVVASSARPEDVTIVGVIPGSWERLLSILAERFGERWCEEKSDFWPTAMRCLRYGILGLGHGWWREASDEWLAALFVSLRLSYWGHLGDDENYVAERSLSYLSTLSNVWRWLHTSPKVCGAIESWKVEYKKVDYTRLMRRVAFSRVRHPVLSVYHLSWSEHIGAAACTEWYDKGRILGEQETRHVCFGLTNDYDTWLAWATGD